MKIKQIITSWDIWLAFVISVVATFLFPSRIPINFAHDVYFMGLSVLSIIFAIFFASLAIIMSSSHDDFVTFLEEKDQYTIIVNTFRFTLILLFIALLLSIFLYVYSGYAKSQGVVDQCNIFFGLFCFIALYALFAVVMATGETITYSKYRSQFLKIKQEK